MLHPDFSLRTDWIRAGLALSFPQVRLSLQRVATALASEQLLLSTVKTLEKKNI